MRRTVYLAMIAVMALMGVSAAQQAGFDGTFSDPQQGLSVSFQVGANGALQGMVVGPNGQFPLQGESGPGYAYGVVQSSQGPLGFQAQLSADGGSLQIAFYTMDANNQPVPQGQAVLQRVGGGQAGGFPAMPGQVPGGANPLAPQQPGGANPLAPQQPGAANPLAPQPPALGNPLAPQQPGAGNPFAPQQPGAQPVQAGVDWNGTFVGDAGSLVLSVQLLQPGSYGGYIQSQGQRYPIDAHVDDQTLHGYFQVNGQQYEFFADRNAGTVMLSIGQATYVMQQTSAQATP